MAEKQTSDGTISKDELTEILAEAEGSTPEEIEQRSEELDVAPPWKADVVDTE